MVRWPQAHHRAARAVVAGDDRLGNPWETQNLPEDQRTGYMGPQECASKSESIPNILFKSDAIH